MISRIYLIMLFVNPGRFFYRTDYFEQLITVMKNRVSTIFRQVAGCLEQPQPIVSFSRFFVRDTNLCVKILFRLGSIRLFDVGAYRSSGTYDLFGQNKLSMFFSKVLSQFYNPECKVETFLKRNVFFFHCYSFMYLLFKNIIPKQKICKFSFCILNS